ncbi:hypothetical protein B0H12DRAFT_1306483, partial [Mycena haematopus]
MEINLKENRNLRPAKKRKVDVVLPDETELDRLFIATLEAGKDEKKKCLALFGPVRIVTDRLKVTVHGSAANVGKISAAAGTGTYWGPNAKRNRASRVWGEQDNMRAELGAVISALQMAPADQSLEISTRSQLAIRSAKYYSFKNDARGWTGKNGDMLKILTSLIKERIAPVHFLHIKTEAGNGHLDAAKALAKEG